MRTIRTFLVVADDPERLMLVSTTLQRKFPNAVVQTCHRDQWLLIGTVVARLVGANPVKS